MCKKRESMFDVKDGEHAILSFASIKIVYLLIGFVIVPIIKELDIQVCLKFIWNNYGTFMQVAIGIIICMEALDIMLRRYREDNRIIKQATAEVKQAIAERDRAFNERDKAIAERDKAIAERDKDRSK